MRNAWRVGALVALWLLAWGEVSLANVVSGVVVASALLVAFPPQRMGVGRLRVDPVGLLVLGAYVVRQLVASNVWMAHQLVRRQPDLAPGVVAHRLHQPSPETFTVFAGIISLSPGTMVVDVEPDDTVAYVHFFRLDDVDAARASLERLDRLIDRAFTPTRPTEAP